MSTTGARKVHAVFKVKAQGRTRLVVFDTQDLTLGRSPENDLVIDDPEISRRHCVFKRTPQGCLIEDMGTSNGTQVDGESIEQAALSHGSVIRLGEVEITYAETTRNPASLGPTVEYASQLKSFNSPLAGGTGDGEATILGLMDTLSPDAGDDGFEVRPAGEFAYDLHDMESPAAARDLDAELETLDADPIDDLGLDGAPGGVETVSRAAAPPREAAPQASPQPQVWELDDEPEPEDAPAASRRTALILEIEGLEGDLRRVVEGLAGKVLELPALRVRIKTEDLG